MPRLTPAASSQHSRLSVFASVLSWSVAALPPLLILVLISRYAVNTPYSDEWRLVPLLEKFQYGQLQGSDLWAQYNEHRFAVVRLVMLACAASAQFNLVAVAYLAWALCLAKLLVFNRALALSLAELDSPQTADRLRCWLFPAFSLLLFSLAAREVWIFPLPSLQWQISGLCAALVVWAFARWKGNWKSFGVALLCTALASMSLISGLFLWGACLIGLVGFSFLQRRPSRKYIGAWLLAAAVLGTLYLWNFHFSHDQSQVLSRSPVIFITSFFTYLGAPLLWMRGGRIAAVGGLACGGLAAWSLWEIARTRPALWAAVLPWLMLMAYISVVGAMTAFGRATDYDALTTNRYTNDAALFLLALLVIIAVQRQIKPANPRLEIQKRSGIAGYASALAGVLVLLGVLVCYVQSSRRGYKILEQHSRNLQIAVRDVSQPQTAPADALNVLFPGTPPRPQIGREFMLRLKSLQLGPFAPEAMSITQLQAAREDVSTLSTPQDVEGDFEWVGLDTFGGWAIDRAHPQRRVRLDLYDGNLRLAKLSARWFRPGLDIGSRAGEEHAFTFYVPSALRDGRKHSIHVFIAGSRIELKNSPRTIILSRETPL